MAGFLYLEVARENSSLPSGYDGSRCPMSGKPHETESSDRTAGTSNVSMCPFLQELVLPVAWKYLYEGVVSMGAGSSGKLGGRRESEGGVESKGKLRARGGR